MKPLNELTIVEAREGLRQRKFTVTDLVSACLTRIKERNKIINAFITVCEEEALSIAGAIDKELKPLNKKQLKEIFERKPLLGIAVAIKDNFCTKGILTTAGSKVLGNFISPYDAAVVKKLKAAGAIIIGKTNMDAWAHGSSTETSDWGTTKNPHNLTRSPGGSSGGSAAAVADNMCIAAIGSETAGSIRQPAAWCGVVGLKPTYGLVSRYGLIAMCSSTDSPGPITKTITDAEILLKVLMGKDRKDATTEEERSLSQIRQISPIRQIEKKKLTIGVPKEYFIKGMDKKVEEIVRREIGKFKDLGFKIKEVSLLDPKYAIAVYTIVQRAEVSSNLARFDGVRFGRGRSFFGKEAKRRIMLGTYVLSEGFYDQYYTKAQKVRELIKQDFDKVFKKVDLIIAPTSPTPALPIGESEKSPMFGEMQDVLVEASSLAGLPGISVNCGFINKMPVGMQIIGPKFSEDLILSMAKEYEQSN